MIPFDAYCSALLPFFTFYLILSVFIKFWNFIANFFSDFAFIPENLQVSRVECMLRLPSLDVVFSSKKADGEIHDEFASTLKNNNPAQSGPTPTFSAQSSGDASDDDRSVV